MSSMTAEPAVTIATALKRSVELTDVSDTPRLDVEVLLSHMLGKDRTFLYTWPEHQLSDRQQQQFNEDLRRRAQGEPVAHITGEREFWSLPLKVTADTLIPRPETELLVELALDLPLGNPVSALDLGTGTGAIALALASEKPHWQMTAVDTVDAAVKLAEENRQRLAPYYPGFDNVQVLQSHWFTALDGRQFDLIVSNPPYICAEDQHLQQGDVRFEPSSALVAGDQGLSDIRHIINQAMAYLNDGGWLLLEHGYNQGAEVRAMMAAAGFVDVSTVTDLAGNDRVSQCRKRN